MNRGILGVIVDQIPPGRYSVLCFWNMKIGNFRNVRQHTHMVFRDIHSNPINRGHRKHRMYPSSWHNINNTVIFMKINDDISCVPTIYYGLFLSLICNIMTYRTVACRRCSISIFTLDLIPGFNGLCKGINRQHTASNLWKYHFGRWP